MSHRIVMSIQKQIPVILLMWISFTLTAAEPDHAKQLMTSQATWKTAKSDCRGNYSYTVTTVSFTGYRTTTTITVVNNKVHQRKFEAFSARAIAPPLKPGEKPRPRTAQTTWIETHKTLGSHKSGAHPVTMDTLYQQAHEVIQRDLAPHEKRYVRFFENGLLKSCFYIDTRIADDSPQNGVSITTITLMKN